jgi:NADH dehydrogenase (ubiquinone) Fe-S protein 1
LCPASDDADSGHPQAASRPAAYEIGFVPSKKATATKPKFVYLLNADELDPATIPRDAFVVYQGHHGDLGAQLADVCLPGAAYTEKGVTWVNAEGRVQLGRAAVPPPGASREDWKVIRYAFATCYPRPPSRH